MIVDIHVMLSLAIREEGIGLQLVDWREGRGEDFTTRCRSPTVPVTLRTCLSGLMLFHYRRPSPRRPKHELLPRSGSIDSGAQSIRRKAPRLLALPRARLACQEVRHSEFPGTDRHPDGGMCCESVQPGRFGCARTQPEVLSLHLARTLLAREP